MSLWPSAGLFCFLLTGMSQRPCGRGNIQDYLLTVLPSRRYSMLKRVSSYSLRFDVYYSSDIWSNKRTLVWAARKHGKMCFSVFCNQPVELQHSAWNKYCDWMRQIPDEFPSCFPHYVSSDATMYAHFLFNAFDMDRSGSIRFEVRWLEAAWSYLVPACLTPSQTLWVFRGHPSVSVSFLLSDCNRNTVHIEKAP